MDKIIKKLNNICFKFKIGDFISYEKQNSSQNKVYKVITTAGTYIIKEYTKDAIGNYYYLNKRKEQIRISEQLKNNGIECILPIALQNKYFNYFQNKYYLVYNYMDYKNLNVDELNKEHISLLSKTLGKIHKLNLKSILPCTYKKIIIDFDKYLDIHKNNKKMCELILKNRKQLEDLIEKSNKNISLAKQNLCISHNDYKPKNILWKKDMPVLIDFDATGMSNPTCALIESAFTFSKINREINYNFYQIYLEEYFKDYGLVSDRFNDVIYVSMNGKLQWFQYIISVGNINDIMDMIDELMLFYNNVDKFIEIYNSIFK